MIELLHRREMMGVQGDNYEILPYIPSFDFSTFEFDKSQIGDLSIYILSCDVPSPLGSVFWKLNNSNNEVAESDSYQYLNILYDGSRKYNWQNILERNNKCGLFLISNGEYSHFDNTGSNKKAINISAISTREVDNITFASANYANISVAPLERLFIVKNGNLILDVRPVQINNEYYYMDLISRNKVSISENARITYTDEFVPYQGTLPA